MLRYVSGSTGQEMVLSGKNIRARIRKAGLYEYEWEVDESSEILGSIINGFEKKPKKYNLIIDFLGGKEERRSNANRFFELVERDVLEGTIGRLYFKDYYIECYIVGSEFNVADDRYRAVQKEVKVYAPYPFWQKEIKKQLLAQKNNEDEGGIDFPFDFEFDFSADMIGAKTWTVDHYGESNFQMIFYGPCQDPKATINGYPYQIFTTLESSDYLIIDSRRHSVVKYLANGTTSNLYNSRQMERSVFEKIPSGELVIGWPGTFGIDLILFLERSEPEC